MFYHGTGSVLGSQVYRGRSDDRHQDRFRYWVNGLSVVGLPPYSTGYLNWYQWIILAGVSIPWAVVGANTAHLLPAKQLKYIFIAVMFYMGLKMCGVFAWLNLPI